MLLKGSELLSRFLYEPIWGFFELIHNCIVDTWERIVKRLQPFAWALMFFNLVCMVLLLVLLLQEWSQ